MTQFELEIATGPAPAVAAFPQAPVWLDGNGAICARVFRDGSRRWIACETIGLFSISERQTNVDVWPADGVPTAAVQDFFDRRLQPLLFQARGYQTLHASAARFPSGVVAIAGLSGSGKSTLAYALSLAGHPQIADDALVVDVNTQPPCVKALPFRPQLRGDAARLVTPASRTACHDDASPSRLAAIVLLRQSERAAAAPEVTRLVGPGACVAVMAHAHVFDATADTNGLVTAYASLVDAVPVFELTYRPAIGEIARLVEAVHTLAAA